MAEQSIAVRNSNLAPSGIPNWGVGLAGLGLGLGALYLCRNRIRRAVQLDSIKYALPIAGLILLAGGARLRAKRRSAAELEEAKKSACREFLRKKLIPPYAKFYGPTVKTVESLDRLIDTLNAIKPSEGPVKISWSDLSCARKDVKQDVLSDYAVLMFKNDSPYQFGTEASVGFLNGLCPDSFNFNSAYWQFSVPLKNGELAIPSFSEQYRSWCKDNDHPCLLDLSAELGVEGVT